METFFASCPRGLEPLLTEDLRAAGAADPRQTAGGVHFAGEWAVCYRANLHSRIATRIHWRVGQAAYVREEDIYRLALETPWPQWFVPEQTIRVDVNAVKSPLRSIDFVTLRIKDAICDRFRRDFGRRPSVDTRQPDVRVQGFINSDKTESAYLRSDVLAKRARLMADWARFLAEPAQGATVTPILAGAK